MPISTTNFQNLSTCKFEWAISFPKFACSLILEYQNDANVIKSTLLNNPLKGPQVEAAAAFFLGAASVPGQTLHIIIY